jgi:hypothetical protein
MLPRVSSSHISTASKKKKGNRKNLFLRETVNISLRGICKKIKKFQFPSKGEERRGLRISLWVIYFNVGVEVKTWSRILGFLGGSLLLLELSS